MRILLNLILSLGLLSAEQVRVYFGTGGEGVYSSFLDLETGALTEAEKLVTLQRPTFIVTYEDKLYSVSSKFGKEGGLAAYQIQSDGGLSLINEKPSGGAGCCHVSLNKSGEVLLFSNYSGGSSGCISLLPDGGLSDQLSLIKHEGSSINEARQQKPHPHSTYVGPGGKYVYTPDLGTDQVWTFTLSEGALTLIDKASHPAGGGPRHMKCSQDGKYAYVLSELTLNTVVYDRDEKTGKLSMRHSISNLEEGADKTEMSCSEIRLSADGRFAYVANRDLRNEKRDSVTVFSVSADGGLKRIQEISAEVWIPRNINLSPDGKWLLVAGQKSHEVSVFSVHKDSGKLSYTGHKIALSKAMCVEFLRK